MKTNKKDILSILLGNTLLALAVILFIVPGHLLSGGTTGISLFLNHYFHLPISLFTFIFNFIVFIIGALILGKKFALQTLISTFYYPFILGVFELSFQGFYLTDDILINTLFAGVLVGVAIAIVIKAGASTGGMDIPPLVIEKKLGFPVSVSLYLFDFCILILQIFISDREQVLYGILLVVLYTVILDRLLINGKRQIQLKIISPEYQQINKKIQTDLDRGTTLLSIEGGYTGRPTYAVLTVVSPRELFKLQELIRATDPNAFITINEVREVRGRGFSLQKEYH